MAYLHCHSCNWEQDDFWELKGYTPFRKDIIDDLRDSLFKEKIYMDKNTIEDLGLRVELDDRGCFVEAKKYVAAELIRTAKSILNMNVKTYDDWLKVKDMWVCPECGKNNPDID